MNFDMDYDLDSIERALTLLGQCGATLTLPEGGWSALSERLDEGGSGLLYLLARLQ